MLFPKYLTPKTSTTNVKFIGRLLCLHSPGFSLEGWYPYVSMCFTRASCAIRLDWGSPYITFFTFEYMYPLCDFSAWLYISKNYCGIFKSGSLYISPCPSGCLGRNLLRPRTCIFIWQMIWHCLHGFSWWSILMLVC